MAISDDTAALVAAQLTQAWASYDSQRPGSGALKFPEIDKRVWETYDRLRRAVREVDIAEVVKHPRPPET